VPGGIGELRGQLHLHGPVPGPPGHRPGRAVSLPAPGRGHPARYRPGGHGRASAACHCRERRGARGPGHHRDRIRVRAELPDHHQRGRHRRVDGDLPAARGGDRARGPDPGRDHHRDHARGHRAGPGRSSPDTTPNEGKQ